MLGKHLWVILEYTMTNYIKITNINLLKMRFDFKLKFTLSNLEMIKFNFLRHSSPTPTESSMKVCIKSGMVANKTATCS